MLPRKVRSAKGAYVSSDRERANGKGPILVPIDFSRASHQALRFARDLARALDAPVILLHALDLPSDAHLDVAAWTRLRRSAHARLRDWRREVEAVGIPCSARLVTRPAAVAAVQCARVEGARLIVMSSWGQRGPSDRELGSTAERTLKLSTCPVICGAERAFHA